METNLNVHMDRHGRSVLGRRFELPLLNGVNSFLIEIVACRALDPYCVDRSLFPDSDPQNRDGFMLNLAGKGIQWFRVENHLWRNDTFADFEVLFRIASLGWLAGCFVALPHRNAGQHQEQDKQKRPAYR